MAQVLRKMLRDHAASSQLWQAVSSVARPFLRERELLAESWRARTDLESVPSLAANVGFAATGVPAVVGATSADHAASTGQSAVAAVWIQTSTTSCCSLKISTHAARRFRKRKQYPALRRQMPRARFALLRRIPRRNSPPPKPSPGNILSSHWGNQDGLVHGAGTTGRLGRPAVQMPLAAQLGAASIKILRHSTLRLPFLTLFQKPTPKLRS